MVLFGIKEKSKYLDMPEFYVQNKLLHIFMIVVVAVKKSYDYENLKKNLQKYFMIFSSSSQITVDIV